MPDLSQGGIDEALLARFEAACRERRPVRIEESLPPSDDPRYLATLEALVGIEIEYGWRHWGSSAAPGEETIAGPPPLEVYLQRFAPLNRPEIVVRLIQRESAARRQAGQVVTLDDYRRRFPAVVVPGSPSESILRADLGPDSPIAMSATAALGQPTAETFRAAMPKGLGPGRFGNYEILAEIGRGGMGVVYRARQCSANRMVALKVIRRERLEALPRDSQTSALDRFKNEAQAAARLQHENIVTVYEVGEVDGEQFFSMRYVEGESLADLLRKGPIDNRRAAAYLEPVARALHEAHQQGILHRDLKPQNILIDSKTDRALVADFGLAKLSEGAEEITRAGEVMGTPPYMSPEQARDSASVTALTDVYALGATLYHVVTGRPPFQAATPVETLRQVMDEEPVPPRQLNPSIDRDLETICLKCLEKEPQRRYASAEELAEDLRRYQANEPIVARPIGVVGRLIRWCRRNPIVAGLAATALLLALFAIGAVIVGYIETSAALTVAEENYRQAIETVDKFCTRVSEDTLLNQPGMQKLRKDLLEMALPPLEHFLAQRANDPTIRDELAKTHFRIGVIKEATESPDEAMQSYATARTMQEDLLAASPDAADRLEALGATLTAVGRTLCRQRKLEEAWQVDQEAVAIRRRLVAIAPDEGEFKRVLANAVMNTGILDFELRRPDDARRRYEEAQTLRQEAIAAGFNSPELQRDLGLGYYNMARLAGSQRKVDEAEKTFGQAADVFDKLLAADPRNLNNQSRLIVCYRMLANLAADRKDFHSALDRYKKAQGLMERLAWANPDVPDYQKDLAGLHMNLGKLHADQGDADMALESYHNALTILTRLVDDYPQVATYQSDRVLTLYAIGASLWKTDKEASRQNLEAAAQQLERLIEQVPDNKRYQQQLQEIKKLLESSPQSGSR